MCLAVPAKIIALKDEFSAEVEYMGSSRLVSITLVPGVKIGDWALIHAGYALEVVDEQFAEESLKLWRELDDELGVAKGISESENS